MFTYIRRFVLIAAITVIPLQVWGANGDIHSIYNNTPFFAENDNLGCGEQGAGSSLEGHNLPAIKGGTGFEEAINAQGQVGSTGGYVTFHDTLTNAPANLRQAYRDYYITMRWRYVKWNWDGSSTSSGPEDKGFYAKAPRILVTNPKNGKSIIAVVLEAGPAPWTGIDSGSNNNAKQGWVNPQDGTPSSYRGRVSGFPPTAIKALGAEMRMMDGSGGDLLYAWASDQNAKPGPVATAPGSIAPDTTANSTCNGGLGVGGTLTFPLITTQSIVKKGGWCYNKMTSCHHDYKAADIMVPAQTPVVAAVGGTVISVNDEPCTGGFGGYPTIQYKGDDGNYYFYAHFLPGSLKVKRAGDRFPAGAPLGVTGPAECGQGTPHLHFQISKQRIRSTNDTSEHPNYIDPQPALIDAFKKLPQ